MLVSEEEVASEEVFEVEDLWGLFRPFIWRSGWGGGGVAASAADLEKEDG